MGNAQSPGFLGLIHDLCVVPCTEVVYYLWRMNAPRSPLRIGRYDVLRVLGQGGMGRVFLARDSVLGREVAVKVLRDDLALPPEAKEALFARMRQEAQAAATISPPNLVVLHDMGEDPEVGLFLVFEYIRGETLRERINDGPLDPAAVVRLARELGSVLDRAHDAGVIHRDVKPENILLSREGAKLADFGIARLPDSTLTRAGSTVLGTPSYCAPEALTSGTFSAFSDQFALAATLYEALSGTRAFDGDDALEVATRITMEEPPPLRRGRLGPALPRVHTALARGMAKEAASRFGSCTQLAESVGVALEMAEYFQANISMSSLPPAPSLPSMGPKSIAPGTRRAHNFFAAAALLLIIALLVFGKRRPAPPARSPPRASSTAPTTPAKKPSSTAAPPEETAPIEP